MVQMITIDQENSNNLKSFMTKFGSRYTMALYLLFAGVDYMFYKDFFYEFFFVRILVVLSLFGTNKILSLSSNNDFKFVQAICSFPFAVCALSLNYMVFRVDDPYTSYWAGLAIVVTGLSIGFAFSWPFYFLSLALNIAPLVGLMGYYYLKTPNITYFLNPLFLISITVVCITGRWFYTKLSNLEYLNRKKLAEEVESRNRIIEEKTAESIRLNSLSKQFSPQIIQGIKSGQFSLSSKVHRSEICALFVDIKDSTVKFSTLDRDDLQKIISMYMEDVMGIFLKYDITIDKFLGDGVMGFTNDPVNQSDYLERAILAALEIKNKINLKQEVYSRFWGSNFEIRLGLSSGYASVGFYGSDLHVKSYTAIGRVINLASRINGIAPANGIAISGEMISKIKDTNAQFLRDYNIENKGYPELKGFEHEKIGVFTIDKVNNQVALKDDEDCPHGHGPLMISQSENGIYVMKCRYCDYILNEAKPLQNVA